MKVNAKIAKAFDIPEIDVFSLDKVYTLYYNNKIIIKYK